MFASRVVHYATNTIVTTPAAIGVVLEGGLGCQDEGMLAGGRCSNG